MLLRDVSEGIAALYGVDVERARAQHDAFAGALRDAGVETTVLPADPALPDGCFVEDTAVVAPGRALITRPGFVARRAETAAVRDALESMGFSTVPVGAPATLEGGDVLRAGGRVFVGLSARTNEAGARALEAFLGAPCTRVRVERCLHLKTACTEIAPGRLAIRRDWVDPAAFRGFELVDADDPNALLVNGRCLVTDGTLPGARLDLSEFAKAKGGLTCLALLLPRDAR